MRTSRTLGWIFVAGALAASAVAAIGTAEAIEEMAPTERVLVYARDLEPMHTLQEGDVTVARRPARGLAQDAVRSADKVIGRVTLRGGLAGDVVREANLVTPLPDQGPLALKLESIHRGDGDTSRRVAFALPASTAGGVASELRPGDRVDVLGVMDLPPFPAGGQEPHPDRGSVPTSVMVVRGVPVLATRAPNENASGAAADGVVVLSLLPEEAERVALAVTRGRVFLALRQRNADTMPVPPVQMPDLIAAR